MKIAALNIPQSVLLLLCSLASAGCIGECGVDSAEHPGREMPSAPTPASAVLAVGDHVRIFMSDLMGPGETWLKPVKIGADGTVPVPYVGSVKIAGMTPEAAEAAILQGLRDANACCFNEPVVIVRKD